MTQSHYAPARIVEDTNDCYFYHTVDLPGGYGLQKGEWDLREHLDNYLGKIDYAGKRVLDVGTANGCLCFEMERRGAEVVGYDLSENFDWDGVPYNAIPPYQKLAEARVHLRKINNAWWLTHRLLNSRARVVYGTVYDIPQDMQRFDIAVFGSILLHLRDPFLALQRAAAITDEHIVVTDRYVETTQFMPDPATGQLDTWWLFSPDLIVKFLKTLGFANTSVYFHEQKFDITSSMIPMFTVVAAKK